MRCLQRRPRSFVTDGLKGGWCFIWNDYGDAASGHFPPLFFRHCCPCQDRRYVGPRACLLWPLSEPALFMPAPVVVPDFILELVAPGPTPPSLEAFVRERR